VLKDDGGTVDAPIGRHPAERKKMAVTDRNSRRAVTHYQVLERFRGFTYVRLRLETGRTHQIRVHMAYIGHPVADYFTHFLARLRQQS
jgi:23S rRNA pseudouridine1911/1915/1917 synthase